MNACYPEHSCDYIIFYKFFHEQLWIINSRFFSWPSLLLGRSTFQRKIAKSWIYNSTDVSDILTLTKQTTAKTAKILRAFIVVEWNVNKLLTINDQRKQWHKCSINYEYKRLLGIQEISATQPIYILDMTEFCFS